MWPLEKSMFLYETLSFLTRQTLFIVGSRAGKCIKSASGHDGDPVCQSISSSAVTSTHSQLCSPSSVLSGCACCRGAYVRVRAHVTVAAAVLSESRQAPALAITIIRILHHSHRYKHCLLLSRRLKEKLVTRFTAAAHKEPQPRRQTTRLDACPHPNGSPCTPPLVFQH